MSAETSTGYIPVPFIEDDDASGPPTPRNKQPDQYHPVVTAQPSSELMILYFLKVHNSLATNKQMWGRSSTLDSSHA